MLKLKEAPKGAKPPKITNFSMEEFTDEAGQVKLSIRWAIPDGANPKIESVELDRMDPGYNDGRWESEATGDGLMGWTGDGSKTHQTGPHGRYAFRVRAHNAEGAGPWSDILEKTY